MYFAVSWTWPHVSMLETSRQVCRCKDVALEGYLTEGQPIGLHLPACVWKPSDSSTVTGRPSRHGRIFLSVTGPRPKHPHHKRKGGIKGRKGQRCNLLVFVCLYIPKVIRSFSSGNQSSQRPNLGYTRPVPIENLKGKPPVSFVEQVQGA